MSEPTSLPPLPVATPSQPLPLGAPPERRRLIAILTAIEAVLLAIPLFGQSLFTPPVEPAVQSGVRGCFQGGGGGTTVIDGTAPCTGGAPSPILMLLVLLAVMLGLLVMPVLIGYFSRRWQTALGAPSIPVWALTALVAVLAVLYRANTFSGFSVSTPVDGYSLVFSLVFSSPLILMVLVASGLGGLAWLVHRGFSR